MLTGFIFAFLIFSLPAFFLGVFYGMRMQAVDWSQMLTKLPQDQYDEIMEKITRARQVNTWKQINGEIPND